MKNVHRNIEIIPFLLVTLMCQTGHSSKMMDMMAAMMGGGGGGGGGGKGGGMMGGSSGEVMVMGADGQMMR